MQYRFGLHLKEWQGRCVICQDNPSEVGFLCQACDDDLPLADDFVLAGHFELPIIPACAYVGVAKRAISAFKDNDNPQALPILVQMLSKLSERLLACQETGKLPDEVVILPVPTTNKRLGEKGVFIAGMLAEYLSAMTGFAIYDGVVRVADGVRQRGLGRDERLANVAGAFSVLNPPTAGAVIILDDVITTGATVLEVAGALWAESVDLTVWAVCLAHGD